MRHTLEFGAEQEVLVVELQADGPKLGEVADEIVRLDLPAEGRDLLAQHHHEVEGEEATEDVPVDVVLDAVVIDRARLQKALELPEQALDPKQLLLA